MHARVYLYTHSTHTYIMSKQTVILDAINRDYSLPSIRYFIK